MRYVAVLALFLNGCGFEATIRGQCVLEPACLCDDSCEDTGTDVAPVACPAPQVFTAPGHYSVDLGRGPCRVRALVWGGGGGGGAEEGGGGAYATMWVDTPIALQLQVGGGGYPGVQPDGAGGGGAGSWISEQGEQYLIVAGGGGGGAATQGAPGTDTTGAVTNGIDATPSSSGGPGGVGTHAVGGRGGVAGGGGGGAPGGAAGTATSGGQGGGCFLLSEMGTVDSGVRSEPGRSTEADGSASGGEPFSAGATGRIELRFEQPGSR